MRCGNGDARTRLLWSCGRLGPVRGGCNRDLSPDRRDPHRPRGALRAPLRDLLVFSPIELQLKSYSDLMRPSGAGLNSRFLLADGSTARLKLSLALASAALLARWVGAPDSCGAIPEGQQWGRDALPSRQQDTSTVRHASTSRRSPSARFLLRVASSAAQGCDQTPPGPGGSAAAMERGAQAGTAGARLGVRAAATSQGALPGLQYPLDEETGQNGAFASDEIFVADAWGERAPFYGSGTCPESSFISSAVAGSGVPDAPPPTGWESLFVDGDECSVSTEASLEEGADLPESSVPVQQPTRGPVESQSPVEQVGADSSPQEGGWAHPLHRDSHDVFGVRNDRGRLECAREGSDNLSGSASQNVYHGDSRRIWTIAHSAGAPSYSGVSTASSDGGPAERACSSPHMAQPPRAPPGPQRSFDCAKCSSGAVSPSGGEGPTGALRIPQGAGDASGRYWRANVPGPQSRCPVLEAGSPERAPGHAWGPASSAAHDPHRGYDLKGATPQVRRDRASYALAPARGHRAHSSVCCIQ